jgi:hypothetical protein
MALVRLTGPEYQNDNKRLWDILSPLVRGTSAWEYIKLCERAKDGRRAFRILQLRGEGDAAVDARRTKAEATLAKAQYNGKSKRFTLQSYINLLQGAFNDLEECGDPYSERKKVDTLVKGLVADRYAVARHTIMGDPLKREDFQKAYGYLETMENLRSVTDGTGEAFDRNVSAVENQGKKGGGGNKSGWMPKEEWFKLPIEERKKIQSARDKKKATNKNKGKQGKKGNEGDLKRRLSELATETLRGIEDMDDTGDDSDDGKPKARSSKSNGKSTGEPHDQFGRHIHKLVKFAHGVIAEMDSDGNKKKKK